MAAQTQPKPCVRAGLIRAIQTRRRTVSGLSEDAPWRDRLEALTGLRSLRAMSAPQLTTVLDALMQRSGSANKGPVTAPQTPQPADQARRHGLRHTLTPQVRRARAIWIELAKAGVIEDRRDSALSAFITRQTGVQMGALTPVQANCVVDALKAIAKRHGLVDEGGYVIAAKVRGWHAPPS